MDTEEFLEWAEVLSGVSAITCQDWDGVDTITVSNYEGSGLSQLAAGPAPALIGGTFRYRDAVSKAFVKRKIIKADATGAGGVTIQFDAPVHCLDGDYAAIIWPR